MALVTTVNDRVDTSNDRLNTVNPRAKSGNLTRTARFHHHDSVLSLPSKHSDRRMATTQQKTQLHQSTLFLRLSA
ncbi:hypothetical protein BZG23_11300 [Salinivibrio sp. ML290]|nr:hypothetical protein BZG23_11300 [Salinivibrio sp. ML290]